MSVWFLLDAEVEGSNTIKLRFFDPSEDRIKEFKDSAYRPYFYVPYPLTHRDEQTIDSVNGLVETVRKIDLYTNQERTLAKVRVQRPELITKVQRGLETFWENEIDFHHSYAYDHGLVFGALHIVQGSQFTPIDSIPENLQTKFNDAFGRIRKSDPLKYSQIERWFGLLHQPVPQIKPGMLESSGDTDDERYHRAFVLSRIANLPVTETIVSHGVSYWLKSIIHGYLRRNNILIPTSKELRRGLETHEVPGALTITPRSGIYFNTVVADFESLYPSCIDSYNLSYETVDCEHEECKTNMVREIGHYVCIKRRGFLAALIGALKELRIRWFKPLSKDSSLSEVERHHAEITARLLKLLTVSSYGVSVRIHGLACPPLAESITGYGRWALQTTWNMAEQNGLHPVYGDTDSVFLENASIDKVNRLIETVKEQLRLDLALERRYSICVLSKAKKAYFGILSDGTPDLKGLTAVKSNAPDLIQKVFRDCVKELSSVKNAEEYEKTKAKITTIVQNAIQNLRNRKVELKDLVFVVSLYHDPKEKSDSRVLPQAYQCAVQLMDSGKEVKQRDIVKFIKVKPFTYRGREFTVKPSDAVRDISEINVEDYVRNLTTALNQTFNPMNIKFETGIKTETRITDWLDR